MEGPIRSLNWEAISARVGEDFGASSWRTITQPMVDAFADVTDDHYFLHVDPVRAAVPPFSGTIAHGFFTLSLLAPMAYEVCPYVVGARYPLNYGFNRVRFVSPVAVGSRCGPPMSSARSSGRLFTRRRSRSKARRGRRSSPSG
jgi:acyl dehydratase